jgi:hypothetical protein
MVAFSKPSDGGVKRPLSIVKLAEDELDFYNKDHHQPRMTVRDVLC